MTKMWDEMRGVTFDSRDVIDRLAEMQSLYDDHSASEPGHVGDDYTVDCPTCDPDDAGAEFAILRDIEEQANSGDWEYGETFIPEDEFEDYARQLAEDIGAIPDDASWPVTYIDWPAAAAALRQDYTAYEFDGITYYGRS